MGRSSETFPSPPRGPSTRSGKRRSAGRDGPRPGGPMLPAACCSVMCPPTWRWYSRAASARGHPGWCWSIWPGTIPGGPAMVLVNLARRPFRHTYLSLAAGPTSGGLQGVVRNRNGAGVPGATVVAIGTNSHAVTDDFGEFTLRDLAAGSRIIEARAIGYPPARAQATIRPGLTERMELAVADSIPVLDPVTVVARYEPYLARVGFAMRRHTAIGHFIDTTDIQRTGAIQFEEVLRMVPGVRLRPNGSSYLVELQRGEGQITNRALANYCPPAYFIDGVYFPLPPLQTPSLPLVPEEILGIEVYSNLSSAPPQYQRLDSSCGVILIWTKRGVPKQ